jgi:4'-phosphopantetheinyl transferase
MIGYHLAYDNSLCGMVMTQGRQRQVINIGLGIKQIAVEPRGATVAAYAESHAHKVSFFTFGTSIFFHLYNDLT